MSNYNKYPVIQISDSLSDCYVGWECITDQLIKHVENIDKPVKKIVIECYQGVFEDEIKSAMSKAFGQAVIFHSKIGMHSERYIDTFFKADITDDEIFGYLTRYKIDSFFDKERVLKLQQDINILQTGVLIVYGIGASYICTDADVLIYADMARWEIQNRFRTNKVNNIGVKNAHEKASLQYKRAFFVDWRVCDRLKKQTMKKWDYVLDTNVIHEPKMITGKSLWNSLEKVVNQPFRVVPFFDPGPWGGQWMKEICDLKSDAQNYAWCFDCVPEENSLLLGFGEIKFEIPSIDVVFAYPVQLLGAAVYGRFGDEFPIRFDLLDTMQGGNLSLQVHPLTEYIQEHFGMHYTQDESYYILDSKKDAIVYLGLKDEADADAVISKLKEAQVTRIFDAEAYIGTYPVAKHDHVLIPAGTVHCSGSNSMVLEISATPYIFTFKLWDWGRMGLDGKPRPINISHGKNVIQWDRTETWVKKELLNRVDTIAKGDGWLEERTGLHEREFIETRRHWFTKKVLHKNDAGVNVLNLVEGKQVVVESPQGSFEPFVVHYAETFIIPATIKEYTITPCEENENIKHATIKAYVRNHD